MMHEYLKGTDFLGAGPRVFNVRDVVARALRAGKRAITAGNRAVGRGGPGAAIGKASVAAGQQAIDAANNLIRQLTTASVAKHIAPTKRATLPPMKPRRVVRRSVLGDWGWATAKPPDPEARKISTTPIGPGDAAYSSAASADALAQQANDFGALVEMMTQLQTFIPVLKTAASTATTPDAAKRAGDLAKSGSDHLVSTTVVYGPDLHELVTGLQDFFGQWISDTKKALEDAAAPPPDQSQAPSTTTPTDTTPPTSASTSSDNAPTTPPSNDHYSPTYPPPAYPPAPVYPPPDATPPSYSPAPISYVDVPDDGGDYASSDDYASADDVDLENGVDWGEPRDEGLER